MKKVLTVLLSLIMMMTLASCGQETVSQKINVGALNGPTGMGMVKLMDEPDQYSINVYQSPTDVVAKLLNGDVDMAAVPSNMAAVLYNKTKGKVVAISPITLGVLYIMENGESLSSVADLKGKTIISSGQGGAPEYILQKILQNAGLKIYEDVKVTWLANHGDVAKKLIANKGAIAMIPEPFVSALAEQNVEGLRTAFDMNKLWEEATGLELPMGALVATKSFVTEREGDLNIFLKDYKESVDFVNDNVAEAAKAVAEKGFLPKEDVARKAIPGCNIVLYIEDEKEQGMEMLKKFNQVLFEMAPASVGGALPDEGLYY